MYWDSLYLDLQFIPIKFLYHDSDRYIVRNLRLVNKQFNQVIKHLIPLNLQENYTLSDSYAYELIEMYPNDQDLILNSFTWSYDNIGKVTELNSNQPIFNTDTMEIAAFNGMFSVLKWLFIHIPQYLTHDVFTRAAESGNLEILVWLHENVFENVYVGNDPINAAIFNGHIHIIDWLYKNREEGRDQLTIENVSKYGNGKTNVLDYVYNHVNNVFNGQKAMINSACNNHLEVLKWIIKKKDMYSIKYKSK
jgi:hypothetical protein